MAKIFFFAFILLATSQSSASNTSICAVLKNRLNIFIAKEIHLRTLYVPGKCQHNCARLAQNMVDLLEFPLDEPDFHVAVVKHRKVENTKVSGLWAVTDPTHSLYPRSLNPIISDTSSLIGWKYHVVIIYRDHIIDLDIQDHDRILPGRDYITKMLNPINSVDDFSVVKLNRWEDFEVYKVPVKDFLNDSKFNALNGFEHAFNYPKQSLMDLYISFFQDESIDTPLSSE